MDGVLQGELGVNGLDTAYTVKSTVRSTVTMATLLSHCGRAKYEGVAGCCSARPSVYGGDKGKFVLFLTMPLAYGHCDIFL